MIDIDLNLEPSELLPHTRRLWELSARKIDAIDKAWSDGSGAPVFTVEGRYVARGWTEWTQGFQFGSALLQYDATGDERFLEMGRRPTLERMSAHLTHRGVHDHGFNNISTYGNLLRLIGENRASDADASACVVALQCSGAVQASRWTRTADGGGFIYSFNGPHSLFADTIRSLRSLAVAHALGQLLFEEQDLRVSLLHRLLQHADSTARWTVYYGEGRDAYDVRGRVAHESIFNPANGVYRCPGTQQGYSPFSTWTRGLAWVMCGFAEQLEFLDTVVAPAESAPSAEGPDGPASTCGSPPLAAVASMLRAAEATSDFYLANTPTDGVPYWDTGAPGLAKMGDCLERPSDPFNAHEPVDSSAAAIAAQGLLRLGRYLNQHGRSGDGARYTAAGLTVARALFREPYLSIEPAHQGLLLHSVYHRPNGWDFIPQGRSIPCGESSMWGDYHVRELALMIGRMAGSGTWPTFFGEHLSAPTRLTHPSSCPD